MTEADVFETDLKLYSTGFLQQFSDQLIQRFISLLAIAAGATVDQIGYLNASRTLAANLFQLPFGNLADRIGKRVLITGGRVLNAVALLAVLYVDAPIQVINLVIVASIATSMAIPSWNSLLGDYTSAGMRGRVIARVNGVSYLGGLVAMALAFSISIMDNGAMSRSSYTPIMVMAAAASFLSGLTGLFLNEKPPVIGYNRINFSEIFHDNLLRNFLLLTFIYSLGSSIAMPLFPYIMANKLRLTVWQVALTSITNALVGAVSQRYVGPILDRVGRREVLTLSRVIMASSCLIYPIATNWVHIAIVEAISGFGITSWLSAQSTYIIDIAPQRLRATYLASSMAAIGIATFIGSNLGGQLVQNVLGGGLAAIDIGLYAAGILRLLLGLTYLTVTEKRM